MVGADVGKSLPLLIQDIKDMNMKLAKSAKSIMLAGAIALFLPANFALANCCNKIDDRFWDMAVESKFYKARMDNFKDPSLVKLMEDGCYEEAKSTNLPEKKLRTYCTCYIAELRKDEAYADAVARHQVLAKMDKDGVDVDKPSRDKAYKKLNDYIDGYKGKAVKKCVALIKQ